MPSELSTQPLPRGRKPWTACSLLQLSALSSLLLSNSPSIPRPLETTNNHLPTCPQFGCPCLLELSLIRKLVRRLTKKEGRKKEQLLLSNSFCQLVTLAASARHPVCNFKS
jgi:hypothetical protein